MSNMMVLCLRVAILAILAVRSRGGGHLGSGRWALGSPACFDQWYEGVVEGVS